MELFTSAELASIVADYDQRNGTTIDTELELMSALATAGIRCSGGRNGLQEYLLEAYRLQQQQQQQRADGSCSASGDMGDNYHHHAHLGRSQIGAGGALLSSRGALTPGRSSVTPRRSGVGTMRRTSLGQPTHASITGASITVPPESHHQRSGTIHLPQQLPSGGSSEHQQRHRVGSRVSPPMASDGTPTAAGARRTPQPDASPALRRSLFRALSGGTRHHPGGGSLSLSSTSPLAMDRAAGAELQLSSRRVGGPSGYDAAASESRHTQRNCQLHYSDEGAALPPQPPVPSWLKLDLPMDSASYVQLLLALKASLFRQVISDASHGGAGGAAAHGSNAPVVVERSIAALLDQATNPLGAHNESGGDVLHLGDDTLSGGDDDDDGCDGAAGIGRPQVATSGNGGAARSPPSTKSTLRSGAAAVGVIPPAILQKMMGMPPSMQQQRVAAIQSELTEYRHALLEVLEQGEQWGTFFQHVGVGQTARTGGGLRRRSVADGGGPNDEFGASFFGGSFSLHSQHSLGASSWGARSALDDASPRSAASPLNARRGAKPGGHVTAVVRSVLNGVCLDPSLLLQEYEEHCATLVSAPAGATYLPTTAVFESPTGDRSVSPNSPPTALSPISRDPGAPPPPPVAPAMATPALSDTSDGAAHGAATAFADWLLARQDLVLHQMGLLAAGKPVVDGVNQQSDKSTPSATTGGVSGARRWKQTTPHHGGGAVPSSDLFNAAGDLSAGAGVDALGHLSPILDEAMLLQRRASDVDTNITVRTPRRGDEPHSGLTPVARVVERLHTKLSHLRSIVPMELTFPYASAVVAKDYKRVTSVDEMLRDMCSSLPSSRVHEVACALRDRRHARLSPLSRGREDRPWPQQRPNARQFAADAATTSTIVRRSQQPPGEMATPADDAPTATVYQFGAECGDGVLESQACDTPPPQPLAVDGGGVCNAAAADGPPLTEEQPSMAHEVVEDAYRADAILAADSGGARLDERPTVVEDQRTASALNPELSATAAATRGDAAAADPTVNDEESLMAFWLQGGVPRPAPSPAKYVKQKRRSAQQK